MINISGRYNNVKNEKEMRTSYAGNFRISQENELIESLLANRSKIGKIGRPVQNASGNVDIIF